MQDRWRVGNHRGSFAAVIGRDQNRRRIKLDATDKAGAESAVRQLNIELERQYLPAELTIGQIYDLYILDRTEEKIVNLARVKEVKKTIAPIWGHMLPSEISKAECVAFAALRRKQGCSNGTIRSDLAYVTAALNFAAKAKIIDKAPHIFKPPVPRAREHHLTRDEAKKLIDAAIMFHTKLFIVLAIATAGRPSHILQLTWDRVDLKNRIINLDDPDRDATRKGRARVPINDMALEHLTAAKRAAQTDYVIELDGKPIKSVKKAIWASARRAGLKASPYVLRHTAGVWMAQAGVSMHKIAEYMGHGNVATTIKHYARFHPEFLQDAAAALELQQKVKEPIPIESAAK